MSGSKTTIDSEVTFSASTISHPRDGAIDVMKAISILAVVAIHTLDRFMVEGSTVQIGFSSLRFCIPVFLYCSGLLFVSVTTTDRLFRRIKRVVGPYLIYAIAAQFVSAFAYGSPFPWQDPVRSIGRLIFAQDWNIYYFVFVIVCCYCIGFLMTRFTVRVASITLFISLVIAIFHSSVKNAVFESVAVSETARAAYDLRYVPYWFFFFAMGLFSERLHLRTMFLRYSYVGLILAMLFGGMTVRHYANHPESNPYDHPWIVFYGTAVIWAFSRLSANPVTEYLSARSYGIYLSHIFVVYLSLRLIGRMIPDPHAWMGVGLFCVALVVPLAVSEIASRIPGGRRFIARLGF
ncbi:Acyltransferase family protein [Rubripirellula tenax]|uniref:Acyltransferase family protein n=1 Tax=Rubripirellula tenax TaxID=2528015 RepID=A0A5C6F6K6_9BACT|nr:acyltransferase [Rubripirellula tenax]TWU56885.1 Acyltransferase family protein [Rubripirellula tenax]